MLVLHYTGMPDAQGAIARLSDPRSQVSSHYLVDSEGSIFTLVDEARRAWHAGQSSWHGQTDLNSRSIGIEIDHPGHDGGNPPFPEAQVDAVIELCRGILARWPIPPARVLAHSDIAPARKQDPGERFPWACLHRAGVGHLSPSGARGGWERSSGRATAGAKVKDLQGALRRIWLRRRSRRAATATRRKKSSEPSNGISGRNARTGSPMPRRLRRCAGSWTRSPLP